MEKENLLAAWLVEECNKRNLSWAEASRRAGISQNTISQIVNGTPAGPKRLFALADYFGASHQYVFELAGLLPETDDEDVDPILRHHANTLIDIWHQLQEIDPESAERLMRVAIIQGEMVLFAAQRANNKEENCGESKEGASKAQTA